MKCYIGLYLTIFILASLSGLGSCQIIEAIFQTFFNNCTDVKNFLGVSYGQMNGSWIQPSASRITLVVYGNNLLDQTRIGLPNAGNVLYYNTTKFNTSLPTEIVLHGFMEGSYSIETNILLNSFITKGGRNVILVDAHEIIGIWYTYSSTATQFIGQYLGQELATLVLNGYSKSKIHLTGFSMGAHAAGFSGKTFAKLTGGSLPWITGLDPAGPCFVNNGEVSRLAASDADFVDVIHTNMAIWGAAQQLGDVDFYPNSGANQPGTIFPWQSHLFSIYIYAESVTNTTGFVSVNCKAWWLFQWGACSLNTKTVMGYGVSHQATGTYYLATNAFPPYAKGESGIPGFNFFWWVVSLFA